jgi:hypothetical protein
MQEIFELLRKNHLLTKDVAPRIKSVKVNEIGEFECVNRQMYKIRITQILMW